MVKRILIWSTALTIAGLLVQELAIARRWCRVGEDPTTANCTIAGSTSGGATQTQDPPVDGGPGRTQGAGGRNDERGSGRHLPPPQK